MALARKTEFKLEIIHALTDLGKFYNTTNNFSKAEENLSEALRLSDEINSLSDLNLIYGELSRYIIKTGIQKSI